MSTSSIINYGEMQKRRYYIRLTVELDTPIEKLEKVSKQIEEMLNEREDIVKDGKIRATFQTISDNGYEIMVNAYINETDYWQYLFHKEKINYEIISIIQKENITLAYNTQTLHVKNS